jgi:hypothetical protein
MRREAREISKAFDLLFEACTNIQDCGGCDVCPVKHMCLDDGETSVVEIAQHASPMTWNELIGLSDDIFRLEDDIAADYADRQRKFEIEEAMIGE